jgi:hypothetical protein
MGRPVSEPSDYDQGVIAGRIDARLADHDRHLAKINGSMDRVADRLDALVTGSHDLLLAVQRLTDAAEADRQTVKVTAAALKEAEEARRDQSETRWTPMARLITVIVAVAVVAGVIIAYAALHNGG